MKKQCLTFAMLASITASAQVTNVEPVGANYTNKTVSFRVWWNAGSRNATHLSKVWVWIDYITVNSDNTTSGNSWTRAAVSDASPTASVSYDGSNRKGFWLEGNSGSYSATVTVQLTNVPAKFNWCAYVSDYPPNVTLDNGTYTFKGTTDFIVSSHAQPVTTKTITRTSLTVNSSSTFTDATGCPGIGSLYCPYTGSDLYMDATHLCQQRAGGARNWEAWIADARDGKKYRIVLMPDNYWWMAQPLARDAGTYSTHSSTGVLYYADTTARSPSGWAFPTKTDWEKMITTYGGTNYANIKTTTGWAGSGYAGPGTDYYGISIAPTGVYAEGSSIWPADWYNTTLTFQIGPSMIYTGLNSTSHRGMSKGFGCQRNMNTATETCSATFGWNSDPKSSYYLDLNAGTDKDCYTRAPLRCFRQL
ncbi:MAG: hypothetical protein LBG31_06375 [Prevotellaceae bacterium]|jgi:uncharacterized protein (TIGR02145 family)|nr:hypothetical protein [Prevotellaceae bacterium]